MWQAPSVKNQDTAFAKTLKKTTRDTDTTRCARRRKRQYKVQNDRRWTIGTKNMDSNQVYTAEERDKVACSALPGNMAAFQPSEKETRNVKRKISKTHYSPADGDVERAFLPRVARVGVVLARSRLPMRTLSRAL
jgi:hypothetical protein